MLAASANFGFGLIPDPKPHSKIYNGFHLHAAAKTATYPDSVDLSKHTPPRWNQGSTGSCGGHGTAACITATFSSQGKPLVSPVSPRSVYQMARCVERSPGSNGKLPKLMDGGTYPNAIVRSLALWGANLEIEVDGGRRATDPDYTEYLEEHVNEEPLLGELISRNQRLITGVNALTEDGDGKIDQACLSLASGYPIMGAVAAGNNTFQGYSGEGVLDFCGVNIDHWIMFDGYRKNVRGEIEFHLVNSWGLGIWTPDGCAWVTQDFYQRGVFSPMIANLD